jgi:uncharacterized membrane protein YkvA (DUF1232 family)
MARDTGEARIEPIDSRVPAPRRTGRDIAYEAAMLLPQLSLLMVRLIRDPRVPFRRKMLLGVVVGFVVSPIDLIPDFIAGIGHLDDIVLVSVALDRLLSGAPDEVVLEHWDGSIDALDLVRSTFAWVSEIVPSVVTRFLPWQ